MKQNQTLLGAIIRKNKKNVKTPLEIYYKNVWQHND